VGVVSIEDFRTSVLRLGLYLSKEELASAFSFLDADGDGVIGLYEWLDFWESAQNNLITVSVLMSKGGTQIGEDLQLPTDYV
jgi:Ca2+-binding EF-hand superfamily protein